MRELIHIKAAAPGSGKKYWRSLEELADTPQFREWAEREFQDGATEMLSSGSRRNVLKLMAASFGLAGLTACRRPVEHIMPFARGAEDFVHGRPQNFATAIEIGGAATGLLVESTDGRPTKIEGNPKHPDSQGRTNAFHQAELLNLYDPDRAYEVRRKGKRSSWDEFSKFAAEQFSPAALGQGDGLRFVSERSSSPSLQAVKTHIAKQYPNSRWIEFDSVSFDEARAGAAMVFGQELEPLPQFDKAKIILALDCDFLGLDSRTVLPARQYAMTRKVYTKDHAAMSRMYAVEPNFTITGANADHRLRIRPSEVGAFAAALAKKLNITGTELPVVGNAAAADATAKFIEVLAKDLTANKAASLVVAGPRQPAAVHALVALINQALGNIGTTVQYVAPVTAPGRALADVASLAADVDAGKVKALVVLGGNPAYTFPADANFAEMVKKVQTTVALTYDWNETATLCEWQLPLAHALESWGDVRSLDGTVTIQQPLIQPLHGGKPVIEVAAMLTGYPQQRAYDIVKANWTGRWQGAEKEKRWKAALHLGMLPDTKAAAVAVSGDLKRAWAAIEAALKPAGQGMDVSFYPSWHAWDGRYANNAWLMEAPDPMTKVVWDDAALLSKKTAEGLGVANGDILILSKDGREARLPAMILPGHADNAISVSLGMGRTACGRVGQGVGYNAAPLRDSNGFGFTSGVSVRKAGTRHELVTTQEHHSMEGRAIAVEGTLEEYHHAPDFVHHIAHQPEPITMYSGFDYSKGNQWGMAIDLNQCIGCNACVIACQAENNVPVVGKDQVRRGREMHWLRLDRYFTGDVEDPQAVVQPMACVHCENAPCESVCPVNATVHSPEGLNEMAYNRCVGTRYCSNNCPYKVRRFNFLEWNKDVPEIKKMVFNPEVTVRMRGVMEKCTYCVQRIQNAKIDAKADGRRPIRDGEVMTACQQVCPADAIVFGDVNDPNSAVTKTKQQPRNYDLLAELNTRPRTSFLARLRNPNPELAQHHG